MNIEIGEVVEDIGHDATVRSLSAEIELHIAVAKFYGTLGYVDGFDILSTTMEGCERETAGVAKTVEHPATTCKAANKLTILALIDKKACFLSFNEINHHTATVLIDFAFLEFFAPKEFVELLSC